MNAPVDGSATGQSWLYSLFSLKQVVLLQDAQKLHQVRGPCTFDFDVFLELSSYLIRLFCSPLEWPGERGK